MGVLTSRQELMQLSLHSAPLPNLALSPLVKQTEAQVSELPSNARLHSVAVDPGNARIFCLHVDGCMLVWGGRHGELRHSAQLLPSSTMAAAPLKTLVKVDEESQLVMLDTSWHDGSVRVLEPLSLDVLAAIGAAIPGEPVGTRKAHDMCYVEPVQMLCVSFEGAWCYRIRRPIGRAAMRAIGPPRSRRLTVAPTPAAARDVRRRSPGDGWRGAARRRLLDPPGRSAVSAQSGSLADGPAAVEAICERVLVGHTAALIDATFLPEAGLLAHAATTVRSASGTRRRCRTLSSRQRAARTSVRHLVILCRCGLSGRRPIRHTSTASCSTPRTRQSASRQRPDGAVQRASSSSPRTRRHGHSCRRAARSLYGQSPRRSRPSRRALIAALKEGLLRFGGDGGKGLA